MDILGHSVVYIGTIDLHGIRIVGSVSATQNSYLSPQTCAFDVNIC